MQFKYSVFVGVLLSALGLAVFIGCKRDTAKQQEHVGDESDQERDAEHHDEHAGNHQHVPGSHGGTIVAVGQDNYHIEAIIQADGTLRLYMLGGDETRVQDVELQELTAHAIANERQAVQFTLTADRQAGDAEGKTSSFVGEIPADLQGQRLEITIPNLRIADERFRVSIPIEQAHEESTSNAPAKVTEDAEQELYLTPGGIYTSADIAANGNQTASQKFAGFDSQHNREPKTGERICPITLTKANESCTWIVAGKEYQFCCPPCVDEFVAKAKNEPQTIQPPEKYVKQ